MNREAAIDRIRKLMAFGAHAGKGADGEVEQAIRRARKMMDELGLQEQDVLLNQSINSAEDLFNSVTEEEAFSRSGKLNKWMSILAWAPAHVCEVRFYHKHSPDPRTGKFRERIVYYGLPRDVAVAAELYKQLLVTMRSMCAFRYGESRPKEYHSYCTGFAYRASKRAEDERKAAKQSEVCTAIVLAKEKLTDRYKREKLNLTPMRSKATKVNEAFMTGAADGDKVSLGTNQIHHTQSTKGAIR